MRKGGKRLRAHLAACVFTLVGGCFIWRATGIGKGATRAPEKGGPTNATGCGPLLFGNAECEQNDERAFGGTRVAKSTPALSGLKTQWCGNRKIEKKIFRTGQTVKDPPF